VRITARRLALFVLAAAVVDVIANQAMWYVQWSQGTALALGYNGMMLYGALSFLWVVLLVDAGVLAIRRRMATRPELLSLFALAGIVVFQGLVGMAEPVLGQLGYEIVTMVLILSLFGWVLVALAAFATLVTIIIGTIMSPRLEPPNQAPTPSEPSGSADPTR
jgi:hypothetical protein